MSRRIKFTAVVAAFRSNNKCPFIIVEGQRCMSRWIYIVGVNKQKNDKIKRWLNEKQYSGTSMLIKVTEKGSTQKDINLVHLTF